MEEQLFSAALGIAPPTYVDEIALDTGAGTLNIQLDFYKGSKFSCSECGAEGLPIHDTEMKTWRHLNFLLRFSHNSVFML